MLCRLACFATCYEAQITYASFSDVDEISRQSQRSYEDSIDRGLNFDSYWRSVFLGPSPSIQTCRENLVAGGSFDRENIVGFPFPDDIPEASRSIQDYLLRLVDSCGRQLKSVVNEMYGIMLRHDEFNRESLGRQARIDTLFEELSTLRLLYEGKGASISGE
ncbi:hypothetical protein C5167_050934 [Papaver somniferum]|uniref:Uncharacterized protein n=1 Tax=Papaver somniferum TaxID=3469 RepID=A0A4Y7KSS4_PAPSO|nr:hypothetical protein C5167_050934 [Papaver somniferum]